MTAKESLRDALEAMSEEHAELVLEFYETAVATEDLTEEEIERALQGREEIARGEFITGEDFKRKHSL
jgi:hypothetical protein